MEVLTLGGVVGEFDGLRWVDICQRLNRRQPDLATVKVVAARISIQRGYLPSMARRFAVMTKGHGGLAQAHTGTNNQPMALRRRGLLENRPRGRQRLGWRHRRAARQCQSMTQQRPRTSTHCGVGVFQYRRAIASKHSQQHGLNEVATGFERTAAPR